MLPRRIVRTHILLTDKDRKFAWDYLRTPPSKLRAAIIIFQPAARLIPQLHKLRLEFEE